MENWVLLRKGADFQHISEKFHISPRVASLIRNRDVIGDDAIEKYLNGTIADLYDGMLMKDMDKAVAVLGEKIKENAKIRIIGDYDIDGIQSTYIPVSYTHLDVYKRQGYDTVVAENTSVQFHGGKAKYALYPVWLLNTTWNGNKYTFAMNGQTGKFVGDLPVDKAAATRWTLMLATTFTAVTYGAATLLHFLGLF